MGVEQNDVLDRVIRDYPELTDDEFVAQNLDRWLSQSAMQVSADIVSSRSKSPKSRPLFRRLCLQNCLTGGTATKESKLAYTN